MILYHFTCSCDRHLGAILEAGELRPTDANLHGGMVPVVRDGITTYVGTHDATDAKVVWLLDVPTVDADHGITRNHSDHDKRAARITVDVRDARPWLRWLEARHHDAGHVASIIRTGGGKSAARHWYIVPRPIQRAEWTAVDVLQPVQDGPGAAISRT